MATEMQFKTIPLAPALGIPSASQLEAIVPDRERLDVNHVVGFNSEHVESRPFNLLRSQFIKRARKEGWSLIGITSATPGAGKSFLSANLAAALSCLPDSSVYLFDLDLRRCSQAAVFGLDGETGLEDVLDGSTTDLAKVGRKVGDGNLALFPAFQSRMDSAKLLSDAPFDALISGMRALPPGALVLCDMPPAFANDDAVLIAEKLDAFLLVVEQGVTTASQVKDTIKFLSPTPCLGTVLNRFEGGLGNSYGYGYGYGSKYDAYYTSRKD